MRWTEEIGLVQEEMCRVHAYLSWYRIWWSRRTDVGLMRRYDPFLSEGLASYAERQAYLRMSLQGKFQGLWSDVAAWVSGQKVLDSGHMSDTNDDDDDDN